MNDCKHTRHVGDDEDDDADAAAEDDDDAVAEDAGDTVGGDADDDGNGDGGGLGGGKGAGVGDGDTGGGHADSVGGDDTVAWVFAFSNGVAKAVKRHSASPESTGVPWRPNDAGMELIN